MDNKKFLTASEVAAEFGIDEATLKKFVDDGSLQALADRGTWKYRRDELQAMQDKGVIASRDSDSWINEETEGNSVVTVGNSADDELSYIELDEEALSEHATMITKKNDLDDRTPAEGLGMEDDWFSPSSVDEMKTIPQSGPKSESEVAILFDDNSPGSIENLTPKVRSRMSDSDSDVRLASPNEGLAAGASNDVATNLLHDSDSDVSLVDSSDESGAMGSGILLNFDVGSGATVSSSGSSLRLPQTAGLDDAFAAPDVSVGGAEDSGITLSDSSVGIPGGSAIRLSGDSSSLGFDLDGSGIALDGGSHLGMNAPRSGVLSGVRGASDRLGGDSGFTLGDNDDSGFSLQPADDSGLALDSGGRSDSGQGSGVSVFDEESGLSLSAMDSGLALESNVDSGLSLESVGSDSGLTLESAADSGIAMESLDKTLADGELDATMFEDDSAGRTQTLNIADELDDDSAFDISFDDATQTTELVIDDEEEMDETVATVVKKGRGKSTEGLTGAFRLDDNDVEELDISEELDSGSGDDDLGEVATIEADDDEVFEASDDTFSDDDEAVEDEDEILEGAAAAVAAREPTGPREPAWGIGMALGLIASSVVLVANALVMWAGLSTMWSGADAPGPAAVIIAQLAGLIQ